MTNDIIKKVLCTEKSVRFSVENRYALIVATGATKPQIAAAVEKKFGVHVLAVRTVNVKGGLRRAVTEATYKKAIVTVKAGERIEEIA